MRIPPKNCSAREKRHVILSGHDNLLRKQAFDVVVMGAWSCGVKLTTGLGFHGGVGEMGHGECAAKEEGVLPTIQRGGTGCVCLHF